MKVIQTINDLESLKEFKAVPLGLLSIVEQEFFGLYDALGNGEDLQSFKLPIEQALLTLDPWDDVRKKIGSLLDIEYVEKVSEGGMEYYRIAKRLDHEFQIIYSLVGIYDEETEKWLKGLVEE